MYNPRSTIKFEEALEASRRAQQPSGQRQSDFVSFAGGEGEHRSCAVSRTTGRPAEVLREGSGIRVDGTAGDGLTISHIY
jgi:hypothetical protein